MFKIAGGVLLLTGSIGFSYSLCKDRKMQLQLLRELKYLYQLMQSEMQYTKMPLPMIFKNLSVSVKPPFNHIILQIGQEMTLEQEKEFGEIWKEQMLNGIKGYTLTKEQKRALFCLPEVMNLADCDGQTSALQKQIQELDGFIGRLEEEEKNKNKVIMSLGVAAGMFLMILLL